MYILHTNRCVTWMCYVSPVINVLWRHDTPSDQLQLLHWSIERDSQVDLIGAIMFYCLGLLCLNLTHSLEQMHLCQEQSSINTNATSLSVLITSMTQCTCVQDQTIPSIQSKENVLQQLHSTPHGLLQHTLGQCSNIRSHLQTPKMCCQNNNKL